MVLGLHSIIVGCFSCITMSDGNKMPKPKVEVKASQFLDLKLQILPCGRMPP